MSDGSARFHVVDPSISLTNKAKPRVSTNEGSNLDVGHNGNPTILNSYTAENVKKLIGDPTTRAQRNSAKLTNETLRSDPLQVSFIDDAPEANFSGQTILQDNDDDRKAPPRMNAVNDIMGELETAEVFGDTPAAYDQLGNSDHTNRQIDEAKNS